MTISAHAPVPAGSRLIDADTVDLAAVRRPRSAAFLTELGRRVDHLLAAGRRDQLAEHARALGSTEAEALAAWDAYRRSVTTPAVGRFPVVNGTYRAIPRQADVEPSVSADDAQLIMRARLADPQRFHQLAEAVAVGGEAGKDAVERLAREWGVFPEDSPTRPAGCPSWCSQDHRGQLAEVDGFSLGLVHERVVAELTGTDPTTDTDPTTAAVLVEATTEAGTVGTAPRVVLAVAEGAEGGYPGSEGVQGWTGSPAQARALAAALLAAAELVDGGDAR